MQCLHQRCGGVGQHLLRHSSVGHQRTHNCRTVFIVKLAVENIVIAIDTTDGNIGINIGVDVNVGVDVDVGACRHRSSSAHATTITKALGTASRGAISVASSRESVGEDRGCTAWGPEQAIRRGRLKETCSVKCFDVLDEGRETLRECTRLRGWIRGTEIVLTLCNKLILRCCKLCELVRIEEGR